MSENQRDETNVTFGYESNGQNHASYGYGQSYPRYGFRKDSCEPEYPSDPGCPQEDCCEEPCYESKPCENERRPEAPPICIDVPTTRKVYYNKRVAVEVPTTKIVYMKKQFSKYVPTTKRVYFTKSVPVKVPTTKRKIIVKRMSYDVSATKKVYYTPQYEVPCTDEPESFPPCFEAPACPENLGGTDLDHCGTGEETLCGPHFGSRF